MPITLEDDFGVFAGSEHMLFGLQRFLAFRLENLEEPPGKEGPEPSPRKPWWNFWS
jgi:hypothetical protein